MECVYGLHFRNYLKLIKTIKKRPAMNKQQWGLILEKIITLICRCIIKSLRLFLILIKIKERYDFILCNSTCTNQIFFIGYLSIKELLFNQI